MQDILERFINEKLHILVIESYARRFDIYFKKQC